jgi:hypothetical protein
MDSEHDILKFRLAEFVCRPSHAQTLRPLLAQIVERGGGAVLFGGLLRDLMVGGLGREPHDLDVVISEMSPDLESYLQPYVRRRTRFGGIEAVVGSWTLDIWALSQTWAFERRIVTPAAFGRLPQTTFLNVQAVAVELLETGLPGQVFEQGFFQAICDRVIDVNLEVNPFPEICALNALITAQESGFSLAPKLVSSLVRHLRGIDYRKLSDYQLRRMGRVVFDAERLRHVVAILAAHDQGHFPVHSLRSKAS